MSTTNPWEDSPEAPGPNIGLIVAAVVAVIAVIAILAGTFLFWGSRRPSTDVAAVTTTAIPPTGTPSEDTAEPSTATATATVLADTSERCAPDTVATAGPASPVTVIYCDGEWAKAGRPQTDHSWILRWQNGGWTQVQPSGENATGFPCYDKAALQQQGIPEELLAKTITCEQSSASTGGDCSAVSAQDAVNEAATSLPPASIGTWPFSQAGTGDFDPCADLSYIILGIEGATASSPYHILLYHNGEYLGTATAKTYGFAPTVTQTSDSSIAVVYHWPKPGEGNANRSGESHAQFTWDDSQDKVIMTGEVPNY